MPSIVVVYVLGVLVPTLAGLVAICLHKEASTAEAEQEAVGTTSNVKSHKKWQYMFWCTLFAVNTAFFFINDSTKSSDLIISLLKAIFDNTSDAIIDVVGYLIPFSIYPVAVLSIKVLLDASVQQAVGKNAKKEEAILSMHKQKEQAKLITWILKVIIMIFSFFAIAKNLGLETDDALQVTTIFSLGLSWSMRDWLSSLWAAFLLAFTTDITINTKLQLGVSTTAAKQLTVKGTGLMFVACSVDKENDGRIIHIPNSLLLSSGFVLYNKHQVIAVES